MKPIRVALLGATSHIAKGLIACWSKDPNRELFLYARSPERVLEFLAPFGGGLSEVFHIGLFGNERYDVVINCVGMGSPQKLKENLEHVFSVTAIFDNAVLDYLTLHPETLYVNLSSGAAYGGDFTLPVDELSPARFCLNDLKDEDFYGIAKLHAEARHRALPMLNIVDLRIFGYFSRFIDLNDKFLLSEIIASLKNNQTLVTNPINIWRDFVCPSDLILLIECCIARCPLNAVYDVYSGKEVSKSEILTHFANEYGLKYRIDDSFQALPGTGQKTHYYPVGRRARAIGYLPEFTAIESIKAESEAILTP